MLLYVVHWFKIAFGLIFSALDSGSNSAILSSGQGHCAVFLVRTLYFQCFSLHPGAKWVPGDCKCDLTECCGVTCDGVPSCAGPGRGGGGHRWKGERGGGVETLLNISSHFMLQNLKLSTWGYPG